VRPGLVGYNVQTAAESKHHLIVVHEVTNIGNDRTQLARKAVAARGALGKTRLQAFANRGHFNSLEIKVCEDAGIPALVPKRMTSNAHAHCAHRARVRNAEVRDGLNALPDEEDGSR
jgi:hypothetical protein